MKLCAHGSSDVWISIRSFQQHGIQRHVKGAVAIGQVGSTKWFVDSKTHTIACTYLQDALVGVQVRQRQFSVGGRLVGGGSQGRLVAIAVQLLWMKKR